MTVMEYVMYTYISSVITKLHLFAPRFPFMSIGVPILIGVDIGCGLSIQLPLLSPIITVYTYYRRVCNLLCRLLVELPCYSLMQSIVIGWMLSLNNGCLSQ